MLNDPLPWWPETKGQATILAAAICLVILGKIWTIATFGGLLLGPDTRFVESAEAMLANNTWLWDAGLQDEPIPHLLWKTLGYSGLIAVLMKLFGDTWNWWLFGLQAALSLLAGLFLYRLARNLGLGVALSVLVFLLHQASLPLSTDSFLGSNGLDGSLATIVLADLGVRYLQGRLFRPGVMVVYAGVLSLCYLLRMVYEYWVLLLVLALVAAAVGSATKRRSAVTSVLALCVVFFTATGAYKTWTYARSGHYISSTGGQTVNYMSIVRAARFIAPDDPKSVIRGDSAVDRVLHAALDQDSESGNSLAHVINRRLFDEFDMNAVEIQQAGASRFLRIIAENPIDWLLKVWIRNGRWIYQASLFVGPVRHYDEILWWKSVHGYAPYYDGWRKTVRDFLQNRDPSILTAEALFHGGLRFALRLVGLAALYVLIGGTLRSSWRWLRQGRDSPRSENLLAIYGMLYFLTGFMYSIHFVELRYLSGVVGVGILAMVLHTRSLTEWLVTLARSR